VQIHVFRGNPLKYTDPDGRSDWPFAFTFDPCAEFLSVMSKFDVGTQLAVIFSSALSGNKADQAHAQMLVRETGKEITINTLDVTAKAAGLTSDVAGKTVLIATATGQPEIAGPASVVSTTPGVIETATLLGKASITGNQNDMNTAYTTAKRFGISLLIGTLISGFKGGNSLNPNPINDQVIDFSSRYVPEVYTTLDKQLNE
jgi:hypothetical protein